MIIDGKRISELLTLNVKKDIEALDDKIKLVIILVGENPASLVYVSNKEKACESVGIECVTYRLPSSTIQKEIIDIIYNANNDSNVHGILVQMPLPSHIDSYQVINSIDPKKDVDGLTIINQGKLFDSRSDAIAPATPKGVMTLLKSCLIEIAGKNAVIIGRSVLVGKPMAMLLLEKNATVTIAHSKTQNLKEVTKKADILIVAVGKPKFLTADMVKKDAVVIDVGINRVEGKIVGDVNFEEVEPIASFITPVPKGVGPMTIASLLENILICYKSQKQLLV